MTEPERLDAFQQVAAFAARLHSAAHRRIRIGMHALDCGHDVTLDAALQLAEAYFAAIEDVPPGGWFTVPRAGGAYARITLRSIQPTERIAA